MVLASLREAFGLLRTAPVIWLTGIAIGIVSALDLFLSLGGDSFIAERIGILQFMIFPFFVSGMYGVIKTGNFDIRTYVQQGVAYYFRVLLPSILIFFAAALTAFLVTITLTLLGITPDVGVISFIAIGVIIPILFFTFFYDTAAVFEDQKVFESLKRSIEFVLFRPFHTLVFFFVLIAIFVLIALAGLVVWTALLSGPLESLTQMSQAEIEALAPDDIVALIGTGGIWISTGMYFLVTTLTVTLTSAFKATFFRNFMNTKDSTTQEVIPPVQGEYDEKGRYYKY